jgi:hypothetical protein
MDYLDGAACRNPGASDYEMFVGVFEMIERPSRDLGVVGSALIIFCLVVAACVIPTDWWLDWWLERLPVETGAPQSVSRRLATVTKTLVDIPGGVEFEALPLTWWVRSSYIRMTLNELRGFTRIDNANGGGERLRGAAVTDPKELAGLMTPPQGCGKQSILLSPIKVRQNVDMATRESAKSSSVDDMRSLSADVASKFCFLVEKSASDAAAVPPLNVPSLNVPSPPIVLKLPEVRLEPSEWPVVTLPKMILQPPTVEPTRDWSKPQSLPPIAVAPPALEPTRDWSKPQPLPPIAIAPPAVEPTRDWSNAHPLPPVAVAPPAVEPAGDWSKPQSLPSIAVTPPPIRSTDGGPVPQIAGGGIERFGAVYFELACPQLDQGPRCEVTNGSDEISPKSRGELLGRDALVEKAAQALRKDPLTLIFVVGSADPIGEALYNDKLATGRAQRVADEIVKRACSADDSCIAQVKRRVISYPVGVMPVPAELPVQPRQRRAEVFAYRRD